MKTDRPDFRSAGFERHRPSLQALAHGWLGSAAEAQDAVQDTWLRAAAWPGVPDCEAAWLATALRHVCVDRLRRRRLESRHAESLRRPDGARSAAPSAEDVAIVRDEARSALRASLRALSRMDAAALLLHAVFDFEHAEIADLAGMTESALRQRVHRALGRVRKRAGSGNAEPAPRRAQHGHGDADEPFLLLCLQALRDARAAALIAAVAGPAPVRAAAAPALAAREAAREPLAAAAVQVQVVWAGDAFGLAWALDGVVSCVVPLGPCGGFRRDEAEMAGG